MTAFCSALLSYKDFGGAVGRFDLLLRVGLDERDRVGLDDVDGLADGLGLGIFDRDGGRDDGNEGRDDEVRDGNADGRDVCDEGRDDGDADGNADGRDDGVTDGLRDCVGVLLEGMRVLGAAVGVVTGDLVGLSDGELLGVLILAISSMYFLNFRKSSVPQPDAGSHPFAALKPSLQHVTSAVQLFFPTVTSFVNNAALE